MKFSCKTWQCLLLIGSISLINFFENSTASAQDRGGFRGGAPGSMGGAPSSGGSDRGGDRSSRSSGGSSGGSSDRGGDRSSRSGGFGGPSFGGGFGGGGPSFGGGGPGFGGPGFGGPGGSFSPIDMLKRMDRNGNNVLDTDEMEGPARFFLERMAQNNPRIDLKRPIPLDRLAGEMDRMRQERGGMPGGTMPGAPGQPTQPTEPEPLVPGFDKVEEPQPVQGFGVADENSSIKVEERDLREAADRITRYDTNKDGILSKEEIQNGRWSDDPMQYDRNRDGRLSKAELAVRYAKRRLGEQGGNTSPTNNNDPRSRFATMGSSGSPWGNSQWGNRGGDNGGGWGSRDANAPQGKDEKKDEPKSYRSTSARDKANAVKGLPDWFARSDADADGQVLMSEYSNSWTDEKVAEFAKFDMNSDGIITSRECLAALKNGGSSSSSSSTSSTGTLPRISSTTSTPTASSSAPSTSIVAPAGQNASDANRDWAKRQIERYDRNKDGQLTVDEWSLMIIKPEGADANKDGIITLEEYTQFRSKG